MKSPFVHLIVWILICAATMGAYGYWYAIVTGKSAEVADLENKITIKTQTSARAAAARAALADISSDESLVQSYFIPDTGVVSFIDDLEGRAKTQSATMKVLSVSTVGTQKQGDQSLLLTVSIDGTFDAVMRTIGAVEYAPYDITVSKLGLSKNGKSDWHADVEVTVGSVPGPVATSSPHAP